MNGLGFNVQAVIQTTFSRLPQGDFPTENAAQSKRHPLPSEIQANAMYSGKYYAKTMAVNLYITPARI
jgi:hypothetical protein